MIIFRKQRQINLLCEAWTGRLIKLIVWFILMRREIGCSCFKKKLTAKDAKKLSYKEFQKLYKIYV